MLCAAALVACLTATDPLVCNRHNGLLVYGSQPVVEIYLYPAVTPVFVPNANAEATSSSPHGVHWLWEGAFADAFGAPECATLIRLGTGNGVTVLLEVNDEEGGDEGMEEVVAGWFYRPGDWNRDMAVTSADISAFLAAWTGEDVPPVHPGDFDGNGVRNSADISAFLTAWLAGL
jgi:hypothetical protein